MGISTVIVSTVLNQMPQHASHYLTESEFDGTAISVHWKLNNDSKRPNKYSKTIVVFLSRELLDDFPNYPEPMQNAALAKIEDSIRRRLLGFNPDHSASRFEQPPTERWTISTEEIFG
jgi:hypothetical protein